MKFDTLRNFAALVAANPTGAELIAAIDTMLENETGPAWQRDLKKLADFIADGSPRFTVIARGNGKLPFLAFSALPGREFCPGAGECLKFCYSFRAWRYPAAFCRQVQNTLLLNSIAGQSEITAALDSEAAKISRKFPGQNVDFRLYVDGDFRHIADVNFWMSTLETRGNIAAYGYSKSWRELLSYDAHKPAAWPSNYLLNLSSGSVHSDAIKRAVSQLPIARGEFIAVNVGYPVKSNMHGTREHNANLRQAFGQSAFTCPGKCGDCTPKGHACGSERFRNIPVIIAVH